MAKQKAIAKQVKGKKIATVYDFMRERKNLISAALPKHITEGRLVGIFKLLLRTNSGLRQCSQDSLMAALIQTAQLGLMPGNINHCYYVPFTNKGVKEVQFILGYKGMVELVNRSKQAVILHTDVVRDGDYFEHSFGLEPKLEHKPGETRGEITHCYAIGKILSANEKVFVVLTRADIDKVRNASKAGQSEYSPWVKWFEEMAKKTAIKRLCKILPLSVDIQKQISTDETIKKEISPDITQEKDITNWEDAEVSDEQPAEEPIVCQGCDVIITKEVADISQKTHQKNLCMKCQKENK